MGKYCENCGRQLEPGEVCHCTQQSDRRGPAAGRERDSGSSMAMPLKGIIAVMALIVCAGAVFLFTGSSGNVDAEKFKQSFCNNIGVPYEPMDWMEVYDDSVGTSGENTIKEEFGRNEDVRLDVTLASREGKVESVVVSVDDWLSSRKYFDSDTGSWEDSDSDISADEQLNGYAAAALSAWLGCSYEKAEEKIRKCGDIGDNSPYTLGKDLHIIYEHDGERARCYIYQSEGVDI